MIDLESSPVMPEVNPRLFSFVGSDEGRWRIIDQIPLLGDPLPNVQRVDVRNEYSTLDKPSDEAWVLRGVTSNERYVTVEEKRKLMPIQPELGRPEATCAVMIPMRKSAEWWSLPQDERRRIFARSGHNDIGMEALPAIARRLHHCRDLATVQRFDFITWFEFSPEDSSVFNALMEGLRGTEEWQYVDQEVEIRMELAT